MHKDTGHLENYRLKVKSLTASLARGENVEENQKHLEVFKKAIKEIEEENQEDEPSPELELPPS